MVALNRKSQLDTLRFGTQSPKSHWPLSFSAPKPQRFKSQRLQDANATKKSPMLAFYKSQRFSATKVPDQARPTNSLREKQHSKRWKRSCHDTSWTEPALTRGTLMSHSCTRVLSQDFLLAVSGLQSLSYVTQQA